MTVELQEKEIAKNRAKEIKKILDDASPLTRLYLAEFMTFEDGEPMMNADIWEAIEEIEEDVSFQPIERELQIGLSLGSINVKIFLKGDEDDSEIDYEILDDK
jgi:hypothetical protein